MEESAIAQRLYKPPKIASSHIGAAHIQPNANEQARLLHVAAIITRVRPYLSDAQPPMMLPATLTTCDMAAMAMPWDGMSPPSGAANTRYAGSQAHKAINSQQ